ncbi:MAG: hypothetical protein ACRDG7_12385 [Candidatus Limnocylindria bacterium]
MKVLLDEMLPIGVRELLPDHDVATAAYAGLAGLPNGELIERAVAAGFDVILSLDRGIPHQQNLARHAIGFVLISDNDVELIRPYVDRLSTAVDAASPGSAVRVAP